jgi:hypothetical protein
VAAAGCPAAKATGFAAAAGAAAAGKPAPSIATLALPIQAASVIFGTGVLNFSTIQFLTFVIVARSAAIAHCKCLCGGIGHNQEKGTR